MKPTVIGSNKIEHPTAIPSQQRKPMGPTAITPHNTVGSQVKILATPTAMKGVLKESTDQIAQRMKAALPDIHTRLIDRAVSMYDVSSITVCSSIGANLQEQYWELINRFSVLVERGVLSDANRHVQRMYSLFQEIYEAPESKGFFRIDMWTLYESKKGEIHQIHSILKKSLPEMQNVHSELLSLTNEYHELELNVKATLAVLLYLEHRGGQDQDIIQLRKLSLFETSAAIQNGNVIREGVLHGISSLIEKVSGIILVKVPAWVENVSLTLINHRTKTDAYQFKTELNAIMLKLKETVC